MPHRGINVLDKGFIELVDRMGDDNTVVDAARVSFAKDRSTVHGDLEINPEEEERDRKLIRYLAKHKHVSPFYHPHLMFKVKAPISVQRQWFKHKIGTAENSESTRYIEVHDDFYVPTVMRTQAVSNKQGSEGVLDDSEPYSGPGSMQSGWHTYMTRQEAARERYTMACEDAYSCYSALLKLGVAKEQAREVLPLCTYTSWVWTASLYAVIHFLELRDESHAQFEIRAYAQAMRLLVEPHFPVSLAAFAAK